MTFAANILSAVIPGLTPQGASQGASLFGQSAAKAGGLTGLEGMLDGLFGNEAVATTDQDEASPFSDELAAALGAALQASTPVQIQQPPAKMEESADSAIVGEPAGKTAATPFMISAAAKAVAVPPVDQAQDVANDAEALTVKGAEQPAITETPQSTGMLVAKVDADAPMASAPRTPEQKLASSPSPSPADVKPAAPQSATPVIAAIDAPKAAADAVAPAPELLPNPTEESAAVLQAAVNQPPAAPAAGDRDSKVKGRAGQSPSVAVKATSEPTPNAGPIAPATPEAAAAPSLSHSTETVTEAAVAAVKSAEHEDAPVVAEADRAPAQSDPTLAAAQAAQAPAAQAEPPKVTAHTVAHLAAQVVHKSEGGKTTRFDVALNPEGLGKVDVRIEIGARGDVIAQMNFDNPEAASQMKARAGELQAALTQAGFDADKTSLSFNSGGASQDGLWRQQDQNQGGGSRSAWNGRAFSQIADEADAASLPAAWSRRGSAAGVDVRI